MQIKITRLDINSLIEFISKLTSVDKIVYLKISGDRFISSVYLPDKDAVKLQEITLDEVMSFNKQPEGDLKISFFNGNKTIEALQNFNNTDVDEITGSIEYAEYDGEYVATSIKVSSPDLTIKLACTDPVLGFMDMTDEQISVVFDKTDYLFEFNLPLFMQSKINSIFNLDKDSDTFKIVYEDGSVRIKGDQESYNAKITTTDKSRIENNETLLYKKYLKLLDKETYTVFVCPNKLVFKSVDSNTLLTVSNCQND